MCNFIGPCKIMYMSSIFIFLYIARSSNSSRCVIITFVHFFMFPSTYNHVIVVKLATFVRVLSCSCYDIVRFNGRRP